MAQLKNRFRPSLPKLRFTLQVKLIIAFTFLSGLFCILALTTKTALVSGESAMTEVLATNKLVRLAKEGTINLAKAGQLPKVIETATDGLDEIDQKITDLRDRFQQISESILQIDSQGQEKELVNDFLQLGNDFYQALAGFIPTRKGMLVYTTEYKGEIKPLPDVLSERELGHIKFIRSLGTSIEKKKRLTGGMDYLKCGFYQWYTENPSQDEDIAEVFEEIDPLHRKLHNYAAEIDQLMAGSKFEQANTVLVSANKDLNKLGLYFSGVRNLAADKYEETQEEFDTQLVAIDTIYESAAGAVGRLESFLQDEVLQESLNRMRATGAKNRRMTMLFSALGLGMAILIGTYATWMIGRQIKAFRKMSAGLAESAMEFADMSDHLTDNASNTMQMASEASDAMEETSANLDSVAAAVHEMESSIQEITHSSLSSAEMASEAVTEARKTTALGEELQKTSDAISSVSDTIRSIAFKINLLALNANVEAARAGEAGAGFAVVAAEVKSLAEATAEATDEITVKIEGIQKGSKVSAEAIARITETITNMSDNSSSIAASVEEQSALTADISKNVSGVVQTSQNATGNIHNVTDAAHDTNARSASIQEGARRLTDYADELNRLVGKL